MASVFAMQQLSMVPGDMSGFAVRSGGAGFSLGGLFKSVLKIGGKILPGPLGTAAELISGIVGGGGSRPPPPGEFQPPVPIIGDTECPPGLIWDPDLGDEGGCLAPGSPIGGRRLGGNVVDGRYGPAEVPGQETRSTAICPDGMVLGDDDLCYKHIRNDDRKYPRGRAPLLTGGERNAITTAGQAAKKMGAARKTLEGLGLIKRPARRRSAPTGHVEHLHHTKG